MVLKGIRPPQAVAFLMPRVRLLPRIFAMSDPIACNFCGVDDATVVFGPGVAQVCQIVRCNRCGLMYASPLAKAADYVQILTWDSNFDSISQNPRRYEKERLQVRDYGPTKSLLNGLYPQRGKLLEIGCSFGFLLNEFKKDGWEVLGIEPHAFCCKYAREQFGIEALSTILENAGIPEASVDVVLLNHVIEHLDDPLGTLREINRVLKPNGHLVMETPRYDTLTFKLLGRRERSLSCNGHIYFFTTKTLKNLYEAAGFRLVRLDHVGRSLTVDRFVWNLGVISKSQRLQGWLSQMSRRLRLNKVHIHLNLRDMQRVCVQKVSSGLPVGPPVAAGAVASTD